MDLAFPAIGSDVHTAGRLVVDNGPPMGTPIFCCHFFPPHDKDCSLSGSIAQNETAEKTGCSDGYFSCRSNIILDKHVSFCDSMIESEFQSFRAQLRDGGTRLDLAIIAPIPYLKELCPLGGLELILSNWLKEPEYADYYRAARNAGRFLILDNGIMELGYSLDAEALFELALQFRPALVTPPEVLHDGPETASLAWNFSRTLERSPLYPKTRLLAIAHGRSFEEWHACFNRLISLPTLGRIGIPYDIQFDIDPRPCTDGVPNLQVLARRRIAVCDWIARNHPDVDVHLLGLAYPAELSVQSRHHFIKSNDSSLAVMAGLRGIRYSPTDFGPEVKHLIDFHASFDTERCILAKHNIALLFQSLNPSILV